MPAPSGPCSRPPVAHRATRRLLGLLGATALLLGACSSASSDDTTAGAGTPADAPSDVPADAPADEASTSAPSSSEAAPDAPTTATAVPATETSCSKVVHIGDSTSQGLISPGYLPDPADRVDAQYRRVGVDEVVLEIDGARSTIERLKGQENAFEVATRLVAEGFDGCWVLALGTTDSANIAAGAGTSHRDRIERMLEVIGDDAPILWVNLKTIETTGSWRNEAMLPWNDALDAAAGDHPNVIVYQWDDVVADDWFADDQIHYSTTGNQNRARLIADALVEAYPAGT